MASRPVWVAAHPHRPAQRTTRCWPRDPAAQPLPAEFALADVHTSQLAALDYLELLVYGSYAKQSGIDLFVGKDRTLAPGSWPSRAVPFGQRGRCGDWVSEATVYRWRERAGPDRSRRAARVVER